MNLPAQFESQRLAWLASLSVGEAACLIYDAHSGAHRSLVVTKKSGGQLTLRDQARCDDPAQYLQADARRGRGLVAGMLCPPGMPTALRIHSGVEGQATEETFEISIKDAISRFGLEVLRGRPVIEDGSTLYISDAVLDDEIALQALYPHEPVRVARFYGAETRNATLVQWIYTRSMVRLPASLLASERQLAAAHA